MLLAAAEFCGARGRELLHLYHFQSLVHAAGDFRFGRAADLQAIGDVFLDSQMREERIALEDGVHASPVRRKSIQALAAHPDFAAAGLLEARDEAQQRRFAGTAFTEEGEEFSRGDFERDVLQDFVRAETFGDAADFEQDVPIGRSCSGVLRCGTRWRHGAAFTSFQISMYLARRGTSCQK